MASYLLSSLLNQTQLSAVLDVFRTSTRKEGLGTLAVRPWHAGMQSHDIVTRQIALNTVSMHYIQICACVVCAHIPSPTLNMLPCGELDGSHVTAATDWLCTHSCRCHGLTARVSRPSFCVLVTEYIQHCGKLALVHKTITVIMDARYHDLHIESNHESKCKNSQKYDV